MVLNDNPVIQQDYIVTITIHNWFFYTLLSSTEFLVTLWDKISH